MEIKEIQDELKKAMGKRIVKFNFADNADNEYASLTEIVLEGGLSISLYASDYGNIVGVGLFDREERTNAT